MRLAAAGWFVVVGCSSEGTVREGTPESTAQDDPPAFAGADAPVASATVSSAGTRAPASVQPRATVVTEGAAVQAPVSMPAWRTVTCPFPASECPALCVPATGMSFDEMRQCRTTVVLGCLPIPGGENTDLTCMKDGDGSLVAMSSTSRQKLGPRWVGCTTADRDALLRGLSGPACPGRNVETP